MINNNLSKTEITVSVDYKRLYEQLLVRYTEQEGLLSSVLKEKRALELRNAPIPNWGYDWLSNLQYKVKNLTERIKAFESGEKYIDMKAAFKTQLSDKDREIKKLKNELAAINAQIITVRENWLETFDDLSKECDKELDKKDRELKKMEQRALKAESKRDEWKEKYLEKTREVYSIQTELEDEKEKNANLRTQLNRDYENSSIPSSLKVNKKKIINNREKSGKKPGGQPGHKHHGRKKQEPTAKVKLPTPEEFLDESRYVKTGRIIKKQLIEIELKLHTTEFSAYEYRDKSTSIRVHADFPGDLTDDVTYGGSVKALAFLLNSYCNVSIVKVSDIISELTGGKLRISTGMICGLTKEFSLKTKEEQQKAFMDLLCAPVMNTDFTTIRINGKNMSAIVCANDDTVQYYAREHKGHEGVKETALEFYQGIAVHDHDKTFYKYGNGHQECNDHPLRYLKGVTENEPNLKWSGLMRKLIQEMIHFRKYLNPKDKRNPDEIDPDRVMALEARYDEILEIARKEYEYDPPSKYNMDGYNLYKRLGEYKKNHLLFLHDRRVPYTNSLSERLLRILKRKQQQVMTFRNFESFSYLCDSLGIIATLRSQEENLYQGASNIFNRQYEKDDNFIY